MSFLSVSIESEYYNAVLLFIMSDFFQNCSQASRTKYNTLLDIASIYIKKKKVRLKDKFLLVL